MDIGTAEERPEVGIQGEALGEGCAGREMQKGSDPLRVRSMGRRSGAS